MEDKNIDLSDNAPKIHKLVGINWPKYEKQGTEVLFPEKPPLSKEEARLKAGDEVENFIIDAHQFMKDVLSVHESNEIEIDGDLDIDHPGSFSVDNNGYPHLKLAKVWFDGAASHVSNILDRSILPDQRVKPDADNGETEEVKFKTGAGIVISYCIHSLAHEMYHARQAYQDPEYYHRTLSDNWPSNFWSTQSDKNLRTHGMGVYNSSQGERAANGFALRFIQEYKKRILSKDDGDRSITEKLYLSGVDKLVDITKTEIKEQIRYKGLS